MTDPRHTAGRARIRRGLSKAYETGAGTPKRRVGSPRMPASVLRGPRGDGSGAPRPGPEPVDLPRRDDPLLRDPEPFGALGAVGLHLQLPGGVGVGVDREEAAGLQGQLAEVVGWGAPLGAGVDVRGHVVLGA